MFASTLTLALVFLLGAFFLQATSSAFRTLEQSRSKEQLKSLGGFLVYRAIQRALFGERELESLFFCISSTKHMVRFFYAAFGLLFLALVWNGGDVAHWFGSDTLLFVVCLIGLLVLSLLVGDLLPRFLSMSHPQAALKLSAPISSLFLLATLPICYLLIRLFGRRFTDLYVETVRESMGRVREKILEMIQEADTHSELEEDEKRLLESVATFRDRIVREVMVPRVEMYGLPVTMTVREAAKEASSEGYSRIPVYRDSVDTIAGVLMYRDLMDVYLQSVDALDESRLDGTIEGILKPVLYVPETSRVSHLLQEFRQKQTHLAVVVDEYGGTEGMITIEDCLEEIVGEIADEYDEEEEVLYAALGDGSWIVDARMNIHDVEEHFHIKIPQKGEYDTVGGYAFHVAGEIPAKGLRIHHEDFDLEILETSERCVEKVRIRPLGSKAEAEGGEEGAK